MVWKILCISNIVFNVFLTVVFGMVIYKTIKSNRQKKSTQPVYRKYGSK